MASDKVYKIGGKEFVMPRVLMGKMQAVNEVIVQVFANPEFSISTVQMMTMALLTTKATDIMSIVLVERGQEARFSLFSKKEKIVEKQISKDWFDENVTPDDPGVSEAMADFFTLCDPLALFLRNVPISQKSSTTSPAETSQKENQS